MLKKVIYLMVVSMALVGAVTGCRGPDSGPMTPAGSPGTGTTVPRNNTPGLSGTGDMAPANQGTDTRTRTGTDEGVTSPRTAPPPPAADATRQPSPPIRPNTPPQPPTTEPPTPPTSRPSL